MKPVLQQNALNQLFFTARTPNGWTGEPVSEEQIVQLYDLLKRGPTSANNCPARFLWVRSLEGKERLASVVMPQNRPRIMAAPVTVIIGNNLDFEQTLPKIVTPPERLAMVQGMLKIPGLTESMATRSGTLQGAYLILAARALGLDCWPMSGFDNAGVDREFFAGTQIQSNFICGLGYADPTVEHPRSPRLTFDEAGRFI